ncbi:hypothetical protein GPECTOR_2g1534 [Gonium pectorale]|uniref:Serine-threonine/tyrosine-protein kinase catalytic domain-containing protein n=1 Tax=Gonium pectorale TaxID=33097 RepID=A0A150H1Z5_GONPE|nr:hypothetical protein GPECTOR_2g1534 [Gonium pectorale]|eukprot:KXZ55982.1 hypothetical protein GPECTOR_2g1534 [Gonium pectorale]
MTVLGAPPALNGSPTTTLDLPPAAGLFAVAPNVTLTLRDLSISGDQLPSAYPLADADFLALRAFQLAPGARLVLSNIRIILPSCRALTMHQMYACGASPGPHFVVTQPGVLSIPYRPSHSVPSIEAYGVEVMCAGVGPPLPCIAAAAERGSQVLATLQRAHSLFMEPMLDPAASIYIYLTRNMTLLEPGFGAAGGDGPSPPPAPTLAQLRARLALPYRALLVLAGARGLGITLDLTGTSSMIQLLDESRVQLQDLHLVGAPPGPGLAYPYGLLRVPVWTFDFPRRVLGSRVRRRLALTRVTVTVPATEVLTLCYDTLAPAVPFDPPAPAPTAPAGAWRADAGGEDAAPGPPLCAVWNGLFSSGDAVWEGADGIVVGSWNASADLTRLPSQEGALVIADAVSFGRQIACEDVRIIPLPYAGVAPPPPRPPSEQAAPLPLGRWLAPQYDWRREPLCALQPWRGFVGPPPGWDATELRASGAIHDPASPYAISPGVGADAQSRQILTEDLTLYVAPDDPIAYDFAERQAVLTRGSVIVGDPFRMRVMNLRQMPATVNLRLPDASLTLRGVTLVGLPAAGLHPLAAALAVTAAGGGSAGGDGGGGDVAGGNGGDGDRGGTPDDGSVQSDGDDEPEPQIVGGTGVVLPTPGTPTWEPPAAFTDWYSDVAASDEPLQAPPGSTSLAAQQNSGSSPPLLLPAAASETRQAELHNHYAAMREELGSDALWSGADGGSEAGGGGGGAGGSWPSGTSGIHGSPFDQPISLGDLLGRGSSIGASAGVGGVGCGVVGRGCGIGGRGVGVGAGADRVLQLTGELARDSRGVVFRGRWRGLPVAVRRLRLRAKASQSAAEAGVSGRADHPGTEALALEQHGRVVNEAAISVLASPHPNVVATYNVDVAHEEGSELWELTLISQAKLGGFRWAEVLPPGQDHTHVTVSGRSLSAYTAPELANDGALGPAADVYAWGVLAWELAWGMPLPTLLESPHGAAARPFLLPTPAAAPAPALRLPVPPAALQWPPHVPPALEVLAGECLRAEPAARPPAAALVQRLEHVVAGMAGVKAAGGGGGDGGGGDDGDGGGGGNGGDGGGGGGNGGDGGGGGGNGGGGGVAVVGVAVVMVAMVVVAVVVVVVVAVVVVVVAVVAVVVVVVVAVVVVAVVVVVAMVVVVVVVAVVGVGVVAVVVVAMMDGVQPGSQTAGIRKKARPVSRTLNDALVME